MPLYVPRGNVVFVHGCSFVYCPFTLFVCALVHNRRVCVCVCGYLV